MRSRPTRRGEGDRGTGLVAALVLIFAFKMFQSDEDDEPWPDEPGGDLGAGQFGDAPGGDDEEASDEEEDVYAGIHDLLLKPFDIEELVEKIKSCRRS